jgi:glycosyltransferase involved in cell wall biosynthesis
MLSRAALPSALEQVEVDCEVIIVDDGSTDETEERLAAFGDPRVRTVRNETSIGVARARNAGIAAALGRWVSFLDDDDLWAPRKLRDQLDRAEAADAVFAYAAGAGLNAQHDFLFAVEQPDPATVLDRLLRWNVIWCGCSNVIARTDVIRSLGGFDEQLFQLADWDLWIRLALAGPAAATEEVLVGYVMHADSMLLTDTRDVFHEMDYLVAKHAEASHDSGTDFDLALFSRWVARGHRRAGRKLVAARTYAAGAVRYQDVGALPRALGSLVPGSVVELARRALANERRSALRKLPVPEPPWIARFRT